MAADFFLKIEGPDVKGESRDSELKDQIELLSWTFGASQPGSARSTSGGPSGRVELHELSVTKLADKATPPLFLNCAKGQIFKTVTLSIRKATGDGKSQKPYMVIKLENVLISGYQIGGSDGGQAPVENISLNYTKITYDYKLQDATKGTLTSAGAVTHDSETGESK
jgi:type VI secretion system secreted protein Hcp